MKSMHSNHGLNIYVFKTRSIIELKKLLVHGSMVRPMVKLGLNQWLHKYVFYILLKFKIFINFFKYIKH